MQTSYSQDPAAQGLDLQDLDPQNPYLKDSGWEDFFKTQRTQEYYQKLQDFVALQRQEGKLIYPPQEEVYQAFSLTPLAKVRVVILGQDPYHGQGQAHGLCFSVKAGIKAPPSLVNIFKELDRDIPEFSIPNNGCLTQWARQGVLLLNTVLTVEQGKAHSHAKAGWETLTQNLLEYLNRQPWPIIFVLWGKHAQSKGKVVTSPRHHMLTSVHPSPLSAYRGFLGCGHFSKINEQLCQQGQLPIDWQV